MKMTQNFPLCFLKYNLPKNGINSFLRSLNSQNPDGLPLKYQLLSSHFPWGVGSSYLNSIRASPLLSVSLGDKDANLNKNPIKQQIDNKLV